MADAFGSSLTEEARETALAEMEDLSRDLGAKIPFLLNRLADALEAATQWRPIESAPQPPEGAYTGPMFLIGRIKTTRSEGAVTIARSVRALVTKEILIEPIGPFTHWAPLPSPPKGEE